MTSYGSYHNNKGKFYRNYYHHFQNDKLPLKWSRQQSFRLIVTESKQQTKCSSNGDITVVHERAGNVVGEAENAGNQHFLNFFKCFQKVSHEGPKHFPKQALVFKCRAISPFPQCFSSFLRTFRHFHETQNYPLQTLLIWKSLKFVTWEVVIGLTHYHTMTHFDALNI